MNSFVLDYVKYIKECIGRQSHVLEVGSLDVNGSVRQFFTDADEYIGLDLVSGKSVDVVADAHDIKKIFKEESFDCVICCETIEHDPKFWITIDNMRWVLKSGGWLIISAPSLQQWIHNYPHDYWRFLPDAFYLIFLEGYDNIDGAVGYPDDEVIENPNPRRDIRTICCFGQKPLKKST